MAIPYCILAAFVHEVVHSACPLNISCLAHAFVVGARAVILRIFRAARNMMRKQLVRVV